MLSALELTLILLAAAVIAVVALRSLGLPPLVAYLAVGVVLGPYADDLAAGDQATHGLGQIGVVFLMFTLGLEFNLPKLMSLRSHVFGLGFAQVATTLALTVLGLAVLPTAVVAWLFPGGLDWRGFIAVGGAVALSSTALVSKLLAERRELETEHGRRVFSVLLFQDLAVIPLLIVIPALASGEKGWWLGLLLALVKAASLLVLLLRFGPRLMRRWFALVARQRSHEVFTLNVLLATLLFGWLTAKAGLSMELGAFVAGMLIAETEFRHQVEEDISPFRDLLLGLFFVTVGMKLDLGVVFEAWPQVLTLLVLPVLAKFALVVLLVRWLGGNAGTAIRSGIWLAQAGEFGFVVISLALEVKLFDSGAMQPALAAMLLSLLASPVLISQANRIALRASAQEWLQRSLQIQRIASRSLGATDHVIIAGYGRSGQALAHVLEAEGVRYLALDLDADRVREASAAGEPVVYGDAAKRDTLLAAGVHRARALAVTFDDTAISMRLLAMARELAPRLPVVVRTKTDGEVDRFLDAGAAQVVPEIAEGSLMLAVHALTQAGVPYTRIVQRVRQVREGRYQIVKGYFHGADDATLEGIEKEDRHLRSISLTAGIAAIGQRIGDLDLEGASVVAIVRDGGRIVAPPDTEVLARDDTVVVSGSRDQVGAAETVLMGK